MQPIGKTSATALVGLFLLFAPPAWPQQDGLPGGTSPGTGPVGAPIGRPEFAPPQVWIQPGPDVEIPRPTLVNPHGSGPEVLREGERLYEWYNCVGCHAPEGGGGMGPPFSDQDWIYGSDPLAVFLSIWEGRPEGMPTFARMIPEDEIWKIVAYVRSLEKEGGASSASDGP